MGLDIPHRWEPQIEEISQAQHISLDEAIDRVVQAGVKSLQADPALASVPTRRCYASFYGSIKGRPSAHGSKEAVDKYIAELRDEW